MLVVVSVDAPRILKYLNSSNLVNGEWEEELPNF